MADWTVANHRVKFHRMSRLYSARIVVYDLQVSGPIVFTMQMVEMKIDDNSSISRFTSDA